MSEIEVTGASPDVAAAVASVRASMADLDVAIAALRHEAVRLRASADATGGLLLLERPVEVDASTVDAGVDPVVEVVERDTAAEAFPQEFGIASPADAGASVLDLAAIDTDGSTEANQIDAAVAADESGVQETDDDQLAAITAAASSRATLPWGDEDEAEGEAFDKFFSADVEPEPAQRWLLDDM